MSNVNHPVGGAVDKIVLVGVQAIAGPETAARLGIPVGSIFDERKPEDITQGSEEE